MNLTLHVWRQKGRDDKGHFETYEANDVLEDAMKKLYEDRPKTVSHIVKCTMPKGAPQQAPNDDNTSQVSELENLSSQFFDNK